MASPVPVPTLGNILTAHARERGTKTALHMSGVSIDYAQLERRARQVANGLLHMGVQPGDRVAYLGKNSSAYFEVLVGAAKARAVMTPINWRLAAPEVDYVIGHCRPRVLFIGGGFEQMAAQVAPGLLQLECANGRNYSTWRDRQLDSDPGLVASENETALLLYTSGTTGRPKGAVLTHRSLFGLRAAMTAPSTDAEPEWYRWSAADVSLIAMPAAHISGTGWAIWSLMHGATGIITEEFDPHAVFDLMIEHRINKIMLVPTAVQIALSHPRARQADFSFLRTICYGGSPMPADLLREAMRVFGCGFVQMYGMTETAGTIVALPPEDHDPGSQRLGSVGLPLPGVEIAIRGADGQHTAAGQVGEIVTRSVANMQGYFLQPEATAETLDAEGWLRTGDAGYLDKQGYLYLRDRVKDMIITGGENVYPAEVEAALRDHPAIADVAVIGVPDEKWGESVCAIVVAHTDAPPDSQSIAKWARERIAGYKCPKHIEFVSALPRNASGKVLRRELRERFRKST